MDMHGTTRLDLSGPKIRSIEMAIDCKGRVRIVESCDDTISFTIIIRRISFTEVKPARETIRKAKTGNHDRPVLTLSDRHTVDATYTSAHLL